MYNLWCTNFCDHSHFKLLYGMLNFFIIVRTETRVAMQYGHFSQPKSNFCIGALKANLPKNVTLPSLLIHMPMFANDIWVFLMADLALVKYKSGRHS